MRFIPDALGRKIGEQNLFASEHAPKILFVGGVVGMVGSTVLACRATLKLSDVLDRIEHDKTARKGAKADVDSGRVEGVTYPDSEFRRDMAIISAQGLRDVAKLYAPAVLVGGVSIFALTKSHNLLRDRNLALTAAYAAVDGAYNRYRERVRDRYGEEADRELAYDTEKADIADEETGEVTTVERAIGAPGSRYARWYDEESSRNWSSQPDVNVVFLRSVQNWANDRLRSRGHIFLNEVFHELGMAHTREGAAVGWRWQKDSGDNYVDFGCWDNLRDAVDPFFNGREGAILLDFNVDGAIWDKIEEDR